MRACSCGHSLTQVHPMTRAVYCTHCDRPCPTKYCIQCRALNAAAGRGPRTG